MRVNDYKSLFISEANEILKALETGVMDLEKEYNVACLEEIFRNAHNMKGMSGAMGYGYLVDSSHALENILDKCKTGKITIRSSEIDILLRVVDLLRELVEWSVEETENSDGERFLAEITTLLSQVNMQTNTENQPAASGVAEGGTEHGDGVSENNGSGYNADNIPDGAAPSNRLDREVVHETHHVEIISTRVDLERLDNLMDLVGELVVSRIRLSSIAHELGSKQLEAEIESSGKLISEIQKDVMEARLVPAEQIFHRFKRLVRDTSKELGKKVSFETIGSEIGLDRTVLERMGDPLVHLIRNAIDHGIESPEERISAGKSETGQISLIARRERNHVVIEVEDDGRGIDMEAVKKKSRQRPGQNAAEEEISAEELCGILSSAGFSTRDRVSLYSGRGVGMNVVKDTIDSLGGTMKVRSVKSEGTTISMYLPINLSIIKTLLFRISGEVHALPIEYVRETVRVELGSFRTIRGKEVYQNGEEVIPIVRIRDLFDIDGGDESESRFFKLIIIDTGYETAGLIVDRIVGQQDVVIKGLPSMMRNISGISGATILGSGKVAFIWDPKILLQERCMHEPDKETIVLAD